MESRSPLVARGMSPKLGFILSWISSHYLDSIPYPNEWAQKLRALAQNGTLVYVQRTQNAAEHLALLRAVKSNELPRAEYVAGLRVWPFQPFWQLLKRFGSTRSLPKDRGERNEALLTHCVKQGSAAELFLKRPRTLISGTQDYESNFIESLVRLARSQPKPIFLVPHFLALRSHAQTMETSTLDAVFGTGAAPGFLRAIWRVIVSRSKARFEVSEPIDLTTFVRDHAEESDAVIAKKVRWSMLHHFARMERVAHGPPLKSPERVATDTLKDAGLREFIERYSKEHSEDVADTNHKAARYLKEIASRFDMDVVRIVDALLRLVWSRIYSGLDADPHDIERIRAAARRGPLVIVPSHRSHVDYLVMSQLLLRHNLMPPRVAAGKNLAFFPLGPILRRGGAFFLRRSFRGLELYARVFRAYVARLLREGFSIEFFIEGGRSRTGKTLPPKLGFLKIVVDAFFDLQSRSERNDRDVLFVPASISYDRIIETESYTRELQGGEKKSENAAGLLKSASVLSSRYGRVFVTFDEPISLVEFAKTHREQHPALNAPPGNDDRTFVPALAHRIVYGIQRAGVVTARQTVAAALLGPRTKGSTESDVLEGASNIVRFIADKRGREVRLSEALQQNPEGAFRLALKELTDEKMLEAHDTDDERVYQCIDSSSLELDILKNGILHHFTDEAVIAIAALSLVKEAESFSRDALSSRTRALSRLFKKEFIYQTELPFKDIFEHTLLTLIKLRMLERTDVGFTLGKGDGGARLRFAAGLVMNIVESYRFVFDSVPALFGTGESQHSSKEKDLMESLLSRGRKQVLSGEIEYAESVHKGSFSFALDAMVELGHLERNEGALQVTSAGDKTIETLVDIAIAFSTLQRTLLR